MNKMQEGKLWANIFINFISGFSIGPEPGLGRKNPGAAVPDFAQVPVAGGHGGRRHRSSEGEVVYALLGCQQSFLVYNENIPEFRKAEHCRIKLLCRDA
jgi:hypothetical protein